MDHLAAYEQRTSRALTALALTFIAVYAVPILWPEPPATAAAIFAAANVAVWLAFAVDLAVRVGLAERRLAYLLHHPIDVLAVALPALRPLKVLRVFSAGHLLLRRGAHPAAGDE